MKINFTRLFFCLFLISFSVAGIAQNKKTGSSSQDKKKYPAVFTIDKADFDNLFNKKAKEVISSKNNVYIDKSTVVMNTLNGDTKFMKIRLSYFPKAYLMVQVNGEYSTQVFVLSDDKSVFYKGKMDNGSVAMTKCNEDDIVSE